MTVQENVEAGLTVTGRRQVPGDIYELGLIHPGLIGCLPDRKMLDMWNSREKASGPVVHLDGSVDVPLAPDL